MRALFIFLLGSKSIIISILTVSKNMEKYYLAEPNGEPVKNIEPIR